LIIIVEYANYFQTVNGNVTFYIYQYYYFIMIIICCYYEY